MRALHNPPASTDPNLLFPPSDLVTTTVKFTKVGFAQLHSQRYVPPKIWEDALQPPSSSTEMGMKLTCGFEMLLSDPQTQSSRAVREIKVLLDDMESGEEQLPTDAEIAEWNRAPDSEEWLDIDLSALEEELAGKRQRKEGDSNRERGVGGKKKGESAAAAAKGGFGDRAAQENLRKMVERFESFLNDDEAGMDGVDDMDFDDDDDDDEDDDEDSDSEEDKDVSFDEAEFGRMMREMMGFPTEPPTMPLPETAVVKGRVTEEDDGDSENEAAAIERDMRAMEAELKSHGALNLDPPKETTGSTLR